MYKFFVHMFCILLFFDQWPLTYGYTVEDKHFRKVFYNQDAPCQYDFYNPLSRIFKLLRSPEPEFVNLLSSPGIDSQPSEIDSWAPEMFTNSGSGIVYKCVCISFRWLKSLNNCDDSEVYSVASCLKIALS